MRLRLRTKRLGVHRKVALAWVTGPEGTKGKEKVYALTKKGASQAIVQTCTIV